MYAYVRVCTCMNLYILACTGLYVNEIRTYQYILVCTGTYSYVLVHTRTYQYILECTSTYKYVNFNGSLILWAP